jgi:hypothetical protein
MNRLFISPALALLALASTAFADNEAVNGGKILSKEGLPACVKTIDGSGNVPRWVVRNHCGGTIGIGWCWHKAFPGWKNPDNVCAKTGVRSSGAIPSEASFEFPDRPHSDPSAKFQVAAMLSVSRTCLVDASGKCPE